MTYAPPQSAMSLRKILQAVAFNLGTLTINESGKLAYSGPALDEWTKLSIQSRKDEILSVLLGLEKPKSGYRLDEFIASDKCVWIYSSVLGEPVLLAGAKADIDGLRRSNEIGSSVVYQGEELRYVLNSTKDGLKTIFEIKSVWPNAKIVDHVGTVARTEATQLKILEAE